MNTHDRHNRTTTLQLILCACLILVLSACSSNDHTAATADTVTEIPQAILKLDLITDGSLLAWIKIDDDTRIAMDVNSATGSVSASIPGLSREVHTVVIEFEYTDGVNTITLATATKTVDLSSGDGSLSFNS